MAETLKLETNNRPSLFNKEMVIGGLLGVTAGLFIPVGGTLAVAAVVAAGVGVVAGGIGGMIGQHRILRENAYGKNVSDTASGVNKDTFLGGAVGLALGVAAAIGTLVLTGDLTTLSTATSSIGNAVLSAAGSAGALAASAAGAALLVPTLLGGMVGRGYGKHVQKREFEQAQNQNIVKHVSATSSPEIAQAVGEKLERDPEWAKKVRADQLAGKEVSLERS